VKAERENEAKYSKGERIEVEVIIDIKALTGRRIEIYPQDEERLC